MIARVRVFRTVGLSAVALLTTLGVFSACKEGTRLGESPVNTANPSPSLAPGSTPIPLVVGDSASGAVQVAGQAVAYAIGSAAIGERIELDLDAASIDPTNQLHGRLTVLSPVGELLASATGSKTVTSQDAIKDPFLIFEAPAAGTYQVLVDDALGGGGATGYSFVLHARKEVAHPYQGSLSCQSAVTLTNFSETILGNTATGTSGCCGPAVLPCTDAVVSPPDLVYRAVLPSTLIFQAVSVQTNFQGAIWLISSCNTAFTAIESACVRGASGGPGSNGLVFKPATQGTYYLYVGGVAGAVGSAGAFQLDVRRF